MSRNRVVSIIALMLFFVSLGVTSLWNFRYFRVVAELERLGAFSSGKPVWIPKMSISRSERARASGLVQKLGQLDRQRWLLNVVTVALCLILALKCRRRRSQQR